MLKVYETSAPNGELTSLFLDCASGVLEVVASDGTFAVPDGALEIVMARYGAPFDAEARISRVATLELPNGRALHHVRHLAGYDVIARDYLLYETPNQE